MDDFSNKDGVALVTGGSGGIGAEICRLLASRGADLVITYNRNEAAAELVVQAVTAAGGSAQAVQLDVADRAAVDALMAQIADQFGALHTLVHSAGPHVPQLHLSRVPAQMMRDQLEEDTFGLFNVAQAALPMLRESSGSIVVVTTSATRRYPVRDGLSAVPKAAGEMLVRGLAAEEGRYGVRANCVGPGMLNDGMSERLQAAGDLDERALQAAMANIAMRRFGSASDIAEAVAFLASDRAGYITGQLLTVDGGFAI